MDFVKEKLYGRYPQAGANLNQSFIKIKACEKSSYFKGLSQIFAGAIRIFETSPKVFFEK